VSDAAHVALIALAPVDVSALRDSARRLAEKLAARAREEGEPARRFVLDVLEDGRPLRAQLAEAMAGPYALALVVGEAEARQSHFVIIDLERFTRRRVTFGAALTQLGRLAAGERPLTGAAATYHDARRARAALPPWHC